MQEQEGLPNSTESAVFSVKTLMHVAVSRMISWRVVDNPNRSALLSVTLGYSLNIPNIFWHNYRKLNLLYWSDIWLLCSWAGLLKRMRILFCPNHVILKHRDEVICREKEGLPVVVHCSVLFSVETTGLLEHNCNQATTL